MPREAQSIDTDASVHHQAAELLRLVPAAELATIAARATGVPGVRLTGRLQVSEVASGHTDRRTVGILRLAGAAETGGRVLNWSAVAKVVDFSVTPESPNLWVRPENEPAVYASGYFDDGVRDFRPAQCYVISRPSPDVVVLWLEDLTRALRAPFDLDELALIVRDLGRWNGRQLGREHALPFTPGKDIVALRWQQMGYDEQLNEFMARGGASEVQAMYGSRSIELPRALHTALLSVNALALTHPRALCFGDCNIGSLLRLPNETVAVDWASLTLDPLGVDAGCVIGSAITWGKQLVEVARHERELFDCYMTGLAEAGWQGKREDVRRGFLFHYGTYLLSMSMMPISLERYGRERIEKRMEGSWAELPGRCAGIVDLIPGYLDELASLAQE